MLRSRRIPVDRGRDDGDPDGYSWAGTIVSYRIVVADDHEIVRRGLVSLLPPGCEVVAECSNGRQAVEKTRELCPDLVVMDINMPELNGLEATRQIVRLSPGTDILILTVHDSEEMVREVLDVGARGYILKSEAGRDLVHAIEAIREHKTFLTGRVSEIVVSGYLRGAPTPGRTSVSNPNRLTPREREVVQLLAEGRTSKEVANQLGISVKTAETHRSRIMAKLDLRSVTELVRYAVRNRIIEP